MKKIRLSFKSIAAFGSLLPVLILVVVGFVSTWDTSGGGRVNNFYLYNNLDTSEYPSLQDFVVIDTVGDMRKYDFVQGDLYVGFELESMYADPQKDYVLEFSNPFFSRIDLYKINTDGDLRLIAKAGTTVGSTTALINPRPSFEFTYEDVVNARFMAIIESPDPIGFDLIFETSEEYYSEYSSRMLLIHLYMGLMLTLFLYNIILFFMIRDLVYLYYSFYG